MDTYNPDFVQIVRQETEGGLRIAEFLLSAMYAEYYDFRPAHQLSAARILADIGISEGKAFAQLYAPQRKPSPKRATDDDATNPDAPCGCPPHPMPDLDPQIAAIIAQETDGGLTTVHFLIDIMEDNFPDLRRRHRFSPWQRLSAARELIRVGFIERESPPKPTKPRRTKSQRPATAPVVAPTTPTPIPATPAPAIAQADRQSEAPAAAPTIPTIAPAPAPAFTPATAEARNQSATPATASPSRPSADARPQTTPADSQTIPNPQPSAPSQPDASQPAVADAPAVATPRPNPPEPTRAFPSNFTHPPQFPQQTRAHIPTPPKTHAPNPYPRLP